MYCTVIFTFLIYFCVAFKSLLFTNVSFFYFIHLLCSWLENSAAFCKLTRGRAGFVVAADGDVIVAVAVVVVVVPVPLDDDCNEFSNNNCCTCVISTYSSDPVVLTQGRGAEYIK